MRTLIVLLSSVLSLSVWAQPEGGEVKVPLAVYTALLEEAAEVPRPAPAAYAIGVSTVRVNVSDDVSSSTASGTELTVSVEVDFADLSWLPFGGLGLNPTLVAESTQERE